MQRLSVVIPNYNYERYVAEAIESALGLDWPDVEVVVVDDGSTDGSLEVIRRYEDRVTIIAAENGTQRVAVNRGLAVITGDVVLVLDSDDVLPPDLARHLARHWSPTVSKAQFRMQPVDADGRPCGAQLPAHSLAPTPEQIRHWHLRTSAYPTPPGSGNAYARWFVDLLAPVDNRLGNASDSALLAVAPLLGDVVSVPDVVVAYRQHEANDSNLLSDPARFTREVSRARARWDYAREVSGRADLTPRALRRSRELLQLRAAARVMDSSAPSPMSGESRRRMLRDAVVSPLQPGPEPARVRVLVLVWIVLVLLTPGPVARRLVEMRYR